MGGFMNEMAVMMSQTKPHVSLIQIFYFLFFLLFSGKCLGSESIFKKI
jgi:hypothetical protein